jgi:hypothetical protein
MKTKEKVINIHADHTNWFSRLAFYQDELKILTKRLEEVSTKNTRPEGLAEVEHFQNKFIIQHEKIDELEHTIIADEDRFKDEINHPTKAQVIHRMEDHLKEERLQESHEVNFKAKRKEFNEFLTHWI